MVHTCTVMCDGLPVALSGGHSPSGEAASDPESSDVAPGLVLGVRCFRICIFLLLKRSKVLLPR